MSINYLRTVGPGEPYAPEGNAAWEAVATRGLGVWIVLNQTDARPDDWPGPLFAVCFYTDPDNNPPTNALDHDFVVDANP